MTTAIIGRQIPTVMTKVGDSAPPTVQLPCVSEIQTLKHSNGSSNNLSIRMRHGMLWSARNSLNVLLLPSYETQNINCWTIFYEQIWKQSIWGVKAVKSKGKTKGNVWRERGGVMVGVLWRQVKANPGRGKPYNFAKASGDTLKASTMCSWAFFTFIWTVDAVYFLYTSTCSKIHPSIPLLGS